MNKCKKQSDIDFTESVQDGKCNRLDLISRQDVLALAKDVTLQNGCKHRCIDATMIHELPSAEPEIVRCKDCKWKQGAECVRFAEVRPFPDDFCSRAERRTDE